MNAAIRLTLPLALRTYALRRRASTKRARAGIAGPVLALALLSSGCGVGLSLSLSIPIITGVTPSSISAGDTAQTVTITGTGFNSAVPLANGKPLAIVSVTNVQIVATIPASMTATPGAISISVVNLLPSGNVTSNGITITVTSSGPPPPTSTPDLTITKTHTGNFTQGQTGATYTITVSNIGSGPSSGMVSVTDNLPASLTLTAISGSGWVCVTATASCTRSDALAAAASYPAITVTVNVSGSAPASVTNTASVSGGGDSNGNNNTVGDTTTIAPTAGAPAFTIAVLTTPATFTKGGTATYTITVSDSGNAPTNGTVTLVSTLDSSMTQTSESGAPWSCDLSTLTCTISTALAPGASFPNVTLNVALSPSAPGTVTTTFMVSGGGGNTVIKTVSNSVM